MKLYLFNSKKDWDTTVALGVVAESKAQAMEYYKRANDGIADFAAIVITEYKIADGLIIKPFGYDTCSISAGMIDDTE